MPYLAYQRTVGEKIIATIWPEMLVTAAQKRPPHVKLIPITEEEARMSIDELKERYPFETYNYSTETARSAQTGSKVAIAESENILGSARDRSNTDTSS